MPASGGAQLRAVGRDLKIVGGSTARGFRRTLRRNITIAAQPIRDEAQRNALALPGDGPSSMGTLRRALADATQVRIVATPTTARVRVETTGRKMPANQQSLPTLMEGLRKWRHPAWGRSPWVTQAAHPYFGPAVAHNLPKVVAAVDAAIAETAAQLARTPRAG